MRGKVIREIEEIIASGTGNQAERIYDEIIEPMKEEYEMKIARLEDERPALGTKEFP